jgi:hypothetical protein
VKKLFRVAWVLAANGSTACLMFIRLQSTGFYGGVVDLQLIAELLFEVILPVLGIVLELANSKMARFANVGSFAAAGGFWLVSAAWYHSDPFFGVLLLMALAFLIISAITDIIYRKTRDEAQLVTTA